MSMRTLLFALRLLGALAAMPTLLSAGDAPIPQVLNDDTFEKWRGFIHTTDAERAWQGIEWNTT